MNEITQLLVNHGETALFVAVLLEQAGLPVPGGPTLIAAGTLCARGELNPMGAIAGTILACLIPDSIWFFLGRRGGNRVLRLLCRISLEPDLRIHKAQNVFRRHGMRIVAISKFFPGLSAVVPPLAGSFGVSLPRFLFFDAIASLLFGGFYLLLGLQFRAQLEQILALISRFTGGALGLGVGLIGVYLGYRYFRRPRTVAAPRAHLHDIEPERFEGRAIGAEPFPPSRSKAWIGKTLKTAPKVGLEP